MANTWKNISVSKKPDVLVTVAGWSLTLESSAAWATALAQAMPADPSYPAGGVGEAFAVTGPPRNQTADTHKIPPFAGLGDLVGALRPHLDGGEKRIYVIAHSSGTAYADHIFDKLFESIKAEKPAKVPQQIWYYNVDGGYDLGKVTHHAPLFARAFAVSGCFKAKDGKGKPVVVTSLNHEGSKDLGASFAKSKIVGKFVDVDLSDKALPTWPHVGGIVHMALINSKNPLWLDDGKEHDKDHKPYFARDLNPTYAKCAKDNVTHAYFSQSFK